MFINLESHTPNKSQVITRINGKTVNQRIKYINKNGSFKKRGQCNECRFLGEVQIGLGFAFDISCDREEGFWKQRKGSTEKPCEYFQQKSEG